MTDDTAALGPAEVIPIVSNLTADDGAFIVGGQATNLWAWFYRDRAPYLRTQGPFTSQDIDYFGEIDVAQKLADALNGTVSRPSKDTMNTPNTAVVEVNIGGRTIRIDFLNKLLGIQKKEAERGISELLLPAAGGTTVAVSLMHPLLCIKSRVANILHPATRRTDSTAMRQLHAAYHVGKIYIDHSLEDGDHKEATSFFQGMFEYLRHNEFGRQAHIKTPVDLIGILQAFANDQRLDPRYLRYNLAEQIADILAFRPGLEERLARGASD